MAKSNLPVPAEKDKDLEEEASSLGAQIEKNYDERFVKLIKRLAYYLSKVGLPFEEACQILDVEPLEFEAKIENDPLLVRLMKLKELEYKKDLLATISSRARQGDDKLAMWLLEKRFPEEFNKRKGGEGPGSSTDDMTTVLEFIQETSDKNPLVTITKGRAISFKKGDAKILKKVEDGFE